MRFQIKRKHVIDFIFPIALFFVFALSALMIVLLATRIYQSTTEHSVLNYTSRTSLSYISEKLHQCDCDGAIRLDSLEGNDAIVIEQSHEDKTYYTYIYVYEQELRELFIKEDTQPDAAAGRTLLKVQDFAIEQPTDDLLRISCKDDKGQQSSTIVSIKSN